MTESTVATLKEAIGDLLRTFPATVGFIVGVAFGWFSATDIIRATPFLLPLIILSVIVVLVLEIRAHNKNYLEASKEKS
jgi:hypothetical protein